MHCPGFRFGAVSAGIKASGALDLGMIVADAPAACAAVFTSNEVKAAPVLVSQAAIARARGVMSAVVVNSGGANACTGPGGLDDARRMAAVLGAVVGVPAGRVAVASTGVIGRRLPMDRVEAGIAAAAAGLDAGGFERFATAILTTDRAAKMARREIGIGGKPVTLLGCTKGAGMIAPDMATTLTFVVTDAVVAPARLRTSLRRAAADTYNAITVDGDTSTNDMILLMASGAAGHRALAGKDAARFDAGLTELLDELARALMRGGEGVHHVVTVEVRGARTAAAARRVARTIANSPLVKTAIAGADPNWGRFLSAIGNARVGVKPERVELWFDDVRFVAGGVRARGIRADGADLEARVRTVMQRPEYTVRVDLRAGKAEARYLACDLSHEYVSINADYTT